MANVTLSQNFVEFLNSNYWYNKKDKSKDFFTFDIYTDYNDYLDEYILKEIFKQDNPEEYFDEKVFEWYTDSAWRIEDELRNEFCKKYHLEIEDDEWDELFEKYVEVNYPFDFYYNQKINVNISVDTGDRNYDYTLNSHYPHYHGIEGEEFDDKASLVWLAQQQGYTKKQLEDYCNENSDFHDPKGFLQSVVVELTNMSSTISCLTFLVKMTLKECFDLLEAMKNKGDPYDADKRNDIGVITIDKSVECGLYDSWNGGGSVLEIQLEKDVELPIKYIGKALPDGCEGYEIAEVYGVNSSLWREVIKSIKF